MKTGSNLLSGNKLKQIRMISDKLFPDWYMYLYDTALNLFLLHLLLSSEALVALDNQCDITNEQCHEKNRILPMPKQRRSRSAPLLSLNR